MTETKIEPYYQKRAEDIIDALFDKGYFGAEVKRRDMRHVEEWIGFELQSSADSAVRASQLLRKLRDSK